MGCCMGFLASPYGRVAAQPLDFLKQRQPFYNTVRKAALDMMMGLIKNSNENIKDFVTGTTIMSHQVTRPGSAAITAWQTQYIWNNA